MITKFEIVKGHREYLHPLKKGTDYCVSGSATFTVEVLYQGKEIYGVVSNMGYVQLPPFAEDCQVRIKGRDMVAFTIYMSDTTLS